MREVRTTAPPWHPCIQLLGVRAEALGLLPEVVEGQSVAVLAFAVGRGWRSVGAGSAATGARTIRERQYGEKRRRLRQWGGGDTGSAF